MVLEQSKAAIQTSRGRRPPSMLARQASTLVAACMLVGFWLVLVSHV